MAYDYPLRSGWQGRCNSGTPKVNHDPAPLPLRDQPSRDILEGFPALGREDAFPSRREAVLVYRKAFTPTVDVTLMTDHTGLQLNPGADVKVRDVIVGEVRDIEANGENATLHLALRPESFYPRLHDRTTRDREPQRGRGAG